MRIHSDFQDYDMMLTNLRNNFLTEASELAYRHVFGEQTATSDSQWYIKWKGETAILLKNNFNTFRVYANSQIQKYSVFLKNNVQYFDTSQYPVDKSMKIPKSGNMELAISRIKEPMTSLQGLDLDRIEIPESKSQQNSFMTDQTNKANNVWFMKVLIKEFHGNTQDFLKYAKAYYTGTDQRISIPEELMNRLVPIMYEYCRDFGNLVNLLDNQMQGIITYINLDPVSKVQQTNDNAETQLQNLQPDKRASTNAQANSINASADYFIRRDNYLIQEYMTSPPSPVVASASNTATAKAASQINQANSVYNGTNGGRTNQVQQSIQQQQNNTTGPRATVNQKQLIMKKKQVAVNLIKDCFSAKVSGAGSLYKDFITILQTHIATLQENLKKKSYQQEKLQKQVKL